MPGDVNQRGQYGPPADTGDKKGGGGVGGILAVLGITVGIYALSPGARYFYKHGRLPAHRR
jgi:hypothetical protein